MTRLKWDERSNIFGLSHGVLYTDYARPWSGLVSVEEDNGDHAPASSYFDGVKVNRTRRLGEYAGAISSYTTPENLLTDPIISDLSRGRLTGQTYGFSFRNNRELHLIYNMVILRENLGYETISAEPGAIVQNWSFTTRPEISPGFAPSSHFVIDLQGMHSHVLPMLEDLLYGTDTTDPRLPRPEEIQQLIDGNWIKLRITDNGDGTWTAEGDDSLFEIDGDWFAITSPSAYFLNDTQTIFTIGNY